MITSIKHAAIGLAMLSLVLVAGCGGGGGGGGGSSQFAVVEFVAGGTDGTVFRNEPLVFKFSSPVDPESVSINGLRVLSQGDIIPGRIEIDRNVVTWFPVVLPGEQNDYVPNNFPPINGLGFRGGTRYQVQMLGGSPFSIHSAQGRPLSATFNASFTTSTKFLPEEVPTPPSLLTSSPIFDPLPIQDGDPFSSNPDDWPLIDPSRVRIRLDFSEPLHPQTLNPFATITLINISENVVVPGVGEPALVRLVQSPEADSVEAVCLTSLGDRPLSTEPFYFELRIARAVTDLAGNALPQDIVMHFRTADKFAEPNFLVQTETFDTDEFLSPTQSSAKWGRGVLEGADLAARSTIYIPMLPRIGGAPPPNTFNLPHPLVEKNNPSTPNGTSFMMRFEPTSVQSIEGESIVNMSWAPKSGFSFFSQYENVRMTLGHKVNMPAELDFLYAANYDLGVPNNPTSVFEGTYTTPVDLAATWIPWPEFQTDFEYTSNHDLLLFWDMPEGGDTYQLFRNDSSRSFLRNRIFSFGGDNRGRNGRENTQYETMFDLVSKSSLALSLTYPVQFAGEDLGDPEYTAFLALEDPTRAGTQILVEWAGSDTPGTPIPSDRFVPSIGVANGLKSIAFKVSLTADPFTGIVPRIFSISFAVRDRAAPAE